MTLLRNTPLTLVMFFFALGFSRAASSTCRSSCSPSSALSLYTAAFVCETVRGGISTVPEGQAEAARALGLGFTQTLTLIVLPQAVRAVVPPLTSVQIALLKNTTVAAGFSVVEAGGFYRVDQRAGRLDAGRPALGRARLHRPRHPADGAAASAREALERRPMSAPTAVLFDVPGPKARARNTTCRRRHAGRAGRPARVRDLPALAATGQFDARVWEWILYENVQLAHPRRAVSTPCAPSRVGAVLALVFGAVFALGRLSDHGWLRRLSTVVVELFRAVPLVVLMFLFYFGLPSAGRDRLDVRRRGAGPDALQRRRSSRRSSAPECRPYRGASPRRPTRWGCASPR